LKADGFLDVLMTYQLPANEILLIQLLQRK